MPDLSRRQFLGQSSLIGVTAAGLTSAWGDTASAEKNRMSRRAKNSALKITCAFWQETILPHTPVEATTTESEAPDGTRRFKQTLRTTGTPDSTAFGPEFHLTLPGRPEDWRVWMPWAAPPLVGAARGTGKTGDLAQGNNAGVEAGEWHDPLVPQPLFTGRFWYGAPPWEAANPRIGYIPFLPDVVVMPMVSFWNPAEDMGFTLLLDLDERPLDLALELAPGPVVRFAHHHQRLGGGRTLRFRYHLLPHAAGWREALGAVRDRFPASFAPAAANAREVCGLGAYSTHWADFDTAKMKAMGFGVNWKASFDFPYMGQFLPPVAPDEEWTGFHGRPVSINQMRDYSREMRQRGFHVLNYFNVTEFGSRIPQRDLAAPPARDWREPLAFLRARFPHAPLARMPGEVDTRFYDPAWPGGPYTSWEGSVVLDPADLDYQNFLVEQLRRHIEFLPESSGLCIDRLDWLRLFNPDADDGEAWAGGQAVRSLLTGWHALLDRIGPEIHAAGKVIFVNNHTKRLDVLRQIDGIFDEFTYQGCALNTTALLALEKPALGWVADASQVLKDPDAFFQRFLYLGVFPMCPFPGNDHSLAPSPEVDAHYLRYGPLFNALRGRRWALAPASLAVTGDGDVRANLFETPAGLAVVITHGRGKVCVTVRHPQLAATAARALSTVLPGDAGATFTASKRADGIQLDCANLQGAAICLLPLVMAQPDESSS